MEMKLILILAGSLILLLSVFIAGCKVRAENAVFD